AEDWSAQMNWLTSELSKPRKAEWVMMCAHHPLFSNGDHGDNGVLQKEWGPLVRKYNVDVYLCGHDHDLQHLEVPGWNASFFLVGGGGATTRPMRVDKRGPFSQSELGFADFSFTPAKATVRLVDSTGRILHEFEKTRNGKSRVLSSTDSDPAQPRTVKSITRQDLPTTKPTTAHAASRPIDD
ncbi:MAG TPA: metallophosphoesterase, partial [Tepidisphaeraceae bacterium]|nr:metallophosphoesterase [Tepidisphaeraceae bacterium]